MLQKSRKRTPSTSNFSLSSSSQINWAGYGTSTSQKLTTAAVATSNLITLTAPAPSNKPPNESHITAKTSTSTRTELLSIANIARTSNTGASTPTQPTASKSVAKKLNVYDYALNSKFLSLFICCKRILHFF